MLGGSLELNKQKPWKVFSTVLKSQYIKNKGALELMHCKLVFEYRRNSKNFAVQMAFCTAEFREANSSVLKESMGFWDNEKRF